MANNDTISCELDGVTMQAVRWDPAGPSKNGACVMMFPGATGTGPTFERRCAELAGLGYVVFSINMYGHDKDLSTATKAGEHYMDLLSRPEELRARTVAWFETVKNQPGVDADRIAAIGYCFGGKCVLELARSGADLRSVTGYHAIVTTHAPAAPGAIKAEVAIWAAANDPFAPLETFDGVRAELDAAEASYQLALFSYAAHSFTDPDHENPEFPGIKYHPLANAVSWGGTLPFLEVTLA